MVGRKGGREAIEDLETFDEIDEDNQVVQRRGSKVLGTRRCRQGSADEDDPDYVPPVPKSRKITADYLNKRPGGSQFKVTNRQLMRFGESKLENRNENRYENMVRDRDKKDERMASMQPPIFDIRELEDCQEGLKINHALNKVDSVTEHDVQSSFAFKMDKTGQSTTTEPGSVETDKIAFGINTQSHKTIDGGSTVDDLKQSKELDDDDDGSSSNSLSRPSGRTGEPSSVAPKPEWKHVIENVNGNDKFKCLELTYHHLPCNRLYSSYGLLAKHGRAWHFSSIPSKQYMKHKFVREQVKDKEVYKCIETIDSNVPCNKLYSTLPALYSHGRRCHSTQLETTKPNTQIEIVEDVVQLENAESAATLSTNSDTNVPDPLNQGLVLDEAVVDDKIQSKESDDDGGSTSSSLSRPSGRTGEPSSVAPKPEWKHVIENVNGNDKFKCLELTYNNVPCNRLYSSYGLLAKHGRTWHSNIQPAKQYMKHKFVREQVKDKEMYKCIETTDSNVPCNKLYSTLPALYRHGRECHSIQLETPKQHKQIEIVQDVVQLENAESAANLSTNSDTNFQDPLNQGLVLDEAVVDDINQSKESNGDDGSRSNGFSPPSSSLMSYPRHKHIIENVNGKDKYRCIALTYNNEPCNRLYSNYPNLAEHGRKRHSNIQPAKQYMKHKFVREQVKDKEMYKCIETTDSNVPCNKLYSTLPALYRHGRECHSTQLETPKPNTQIEIVQDVVQLENSESTANLSTNSDTNVPDPLNQALVLDEAVVDDINQSNESDDDDDGSSSNSLSRPSGRTGEPSSVAPKPEWKHVIENVNGNDKLKCLELTHHQLPCNRLYSSYGRLAEHGRTWHSSSIPAKPYMKHKFVREQVKDKEVYKCIEITESNVPCNKLCTRLNALYRHGRRCHSTELETPKQHKQIQIVQDVVQFQSNPTWKHVIENVNGNDKFKCLELTYNNVPCNRLYSSYGRLAEHGRKWHSSSIPVTPNMTNKYVKDKIENVDVYKCIDITDNNVPCAKLFFTYQTLIQHYRHCHSIQLETPKPNTQIEIVQDVLQLEHSESATTLSTKSDTNFQDPLKQGVVVDEAVVNDIIIPKESDDDGSSRNTLSRPSPSEVFFQKWKHIIENVNGNDNFKCMELNYNNDTCNRLYSSYAQLADHGSKWHSNNIITRTPYMKYKCIRGQIANIDVYKCMSMTDDNVPCEKLFFTFQTLTKHCHNCHSIRLETPKPNTQIEVVQDVVPLEKAESTTTLSNNSDTNVQDPLNQGLVLDEAVVDDIIQSKESNDDGGSISNSLSRTSGRIGDHSSGISFPKWKHVIENVNANDMFKCLELTYHDVPCKLLFSSYARLALHGRKWHSNIIPGIPYMKYKCVREQMDGKQVYKCIELTNTNVPCNKLYSNLKSVWNHGRDCHAKKVGTKYIMKEVNGQVKFKCMEMTESNAPCGQLEANYEALKRHKYNCHSNKFKPRNSFKRKYILVQVDGQNKYMCMDMTKGNAPCRKLYSTRLLLISHIHGTHTERARKWKQQDRLNAYETCFVDGKIVWRCLEMKEGDTKCLKPHDTYQALLGHRIQSHVEATTSLIRRQAKFTIIKRNGNTFWRCQQTTGEGKVCKEECDTYYKLIMHRRNFHLDTLLLLRKIFQANVTEES